MKNVKKRGMMRFNELSAIASSYGDLVIKINAVSSISKLYKNIDAITNYNKLFNVANFDFNAINTFTSKLDSIEPAFLRASSSTLNQLNSLISNNDLDFTRKVNTLASGSIMNVTSDLFKNYNFDIAKAFFKIAPGIDFNSIKTFDHYTIDSINTSIKVTINDLAEKTTLDDSDMEKIENIGKCALEITRTKDLPNSVKKNIVFNILRNLWNFIGKPQFAAILLIILHFMSAQQPNISEKIIVRETLREIIIIEKEHKELHLRGVISNETRLYLKPNTKSEKVFVLDCGDVVEVLRTKKKWIYVRLYKTDIEGWILKKYTKGTGNRRTNFVII